MPALNLSAIGAGGTLTVSVLANTAKIYGREIALGAPPATPTQKAGAPTGFFARVSIDG